MRQKPIKERLKLDFTLPYKVYALIPEELLPREHRQMMLVSQLFDHTGLKLGNVAVAIVHYEGRVIWSIHLNLVQDVRVDQVMVVNGNLEAVVLVLIRWVLFHSYYKIL